MHTQTQTNISSLSLSPLNSEKCKQPQTHQHTYTYTYTYIYVCLVFPSFHCCYYYFNAFSLSYRNRPFLAFLSATFSLSLFSCRGSRKEKRKRSRRVDLGRWWCRLGPQNPIRMKASTKAVSLNPLVAFEHKRYGFFRATLSSHSLSLSLLSGFSVGSRVLVFSVLARSSLSLSIGIFLI